MRNATFQAEHIGDVSSNGEERSWQKSPNFVKKANRADYVAGPVPDFPVQQRVGVVQKQKMK